MQIRTARAARHSARNGIHLPSDINPTSPHYSSTSPSCLAQDLENGQQRSSIDGIPPPLPARSTASDSRWLLALPLLALVILFARWPQDWRSAIGVPGRTRRALMKALPSIQSSSILIGASNSVSDPRATPAVDVSDTTVAGDASEAAEKLAAVTAQTGANAVNTTSAGSSIASLQLHPVQPADGKALDLENDDLGTEDAEHWARGWRLHLSDLSDRLGFGTRGQVRVNSTSASSGVSAGSHTVGSTVNGSNDTAIGSAKDSNSTADSNSKGSVDSKSSSNVVASNDTMASSTSSNDGGNVGMNKRRLVANIAVVPSRYCQEVKLELEKKCMASGAKSNKCLRMFRGGKYMHSYTTPFVRIAAEMRALGFNYNVTEVGPTDWQQPLDGRSWDMSIRAADIIIVEEHSIQWLLPHYHDKLYVALQGNAAAALLTCSRSKLCAHDHLQRKQVVRYLQHTVLSPLTVNNAVRYRHLPHYSLMNQVHVLGQSTADDNWQAVPNREPPFTTEMLSKVRLLIPMFWRWRYPMTCRGQADYVTQMAPALAAPLGRPPKILPDIRDRPIDIAFSGSTSAPYWRNSRKERKQNALYALHRGRMMEELDRIRQGNPQLRIVMLEHVSYPEFVAILRSCKIFVSPLGHGEYSGKDYEATISRAVMVKPLARHLESYPNIYEVNATCAETRMDFSNLEDVVKGLLADPVRMQILADGAYNRMVKYSNPGVVAADVAAMLHELAAEKGLPYEDVA